MKKFALALVIFLLVLSTAIIKNTTKQIEDEIFTAKENIRVLNSEFENLSLEYDYLSSAERLLEYQSQYFEDEFCLLYTSPSPRDISGSRMPSSA